MLGTATRHAISTPRPLKRLNVVRLAIGGALAGLAIPAPYAIAQTASVQLTTADYARAERFLPVNYAKYVDNADIRHYWIEGEDRFWYQRTDPKEGVQFVVVDAATGARQPAFDHKNIADGLTAILKRPINAAALPFAHFRYIPDGAGITLQIGQVRYACQTATANCHIDAELKYAEVLSPDGKWAAFLKDENLWIRPVSGGNPFALTTDGVQYHGYGTAQGVSLNALRLVRAGIAPPPRVLWSPDSTRLLSYRIEERDVKPAYLVQAVPDDGSTRPKLFSFPYAMPGDATRSRYEPIIFDVAKRSQLKLNTPPLDATHLPAFQRREAWWNADGSSIYFLANHRFLKSVTLNRADPVTGAVTPLIQETSPTFVQVNSDLFEVPTIKTLANGDVVWFSQRDGWGQLYRYGADGKLKNRITNGQWTVRGLPRVDEAAGLVYFIASGREKGDPYRRYLYSVRLDGRDLKLLTPEPADHALPGELLTAMSPLPDAKAGAERNRFSGSGRYFVDSYSTPGTPPTLVLRDRNGRLIKGLETADISRLKAGGYVPIEEFEVTAADGTTKIYGNLYRPSNFDPSKRYPVIESVYPGPTLPRVGKNFGSALYGSFDGFEAQSLAELGFIVVTIDGRGSPGRAKAFLDHAYGRPDKGSDLDDHIAGLKQLAERYPYMDLTRVGMDGLSGGGYATAHALLAYPDFYKVGVSAAGNHEQTAYAAPYWDVNVGDIDQPGYKTGSNLPLAGQLKGKLLLATGDMDDNVSPTLTIKLADALVKANKDFDLVIVPNADHAVSFHPYFIRRKWDYFVRHLQGATPPADFRIGAPR